MGKRQTRRTLSLSGLVYQGVKKHCDATGQTVAGYVTRLIEADRRRRGDPEETVLRPSQRANTEPKGPRPSHGGIFTF